MWNAARKSTQNSDGRNDRRPGGAWRTGAPWVLWGLLVAGLFFGAIFRGESFFERDLGSFHRPFRALLVRLWHEAGLIPLWNPLSNMGQEFAANPHYAVFHPLSWLFLFLPWEAAFRLQVIVPLVGTALAMLFFLRTIGLGRPAAQVGALSWGFGGLALSLTNLLPMLLTIAPAPALAAFAVRLGRGGGRRDTVGAAVCAALVCAGGEPVTIVIVAVIAAAAALLELPSAAAAPGRRRRAAAAALARLAGAAVLGAAVAAVVIVPALRLGARSARAAGLTPADAASWSLPPVRLVELWLPGAMGAVDTADLDRFWGAGLYPTRRSPFIYSLYPGLLITALAAAGALRPGRRRFGWSLLALLGAAMALGRHGPLWGATRAVLPAFDGLRYPEKWVILPIFAIVVLAADELDSLLAGSEAAARRLRRVLLGLAALSAAAAGGVLAVTATSGPGAWRWLGLSREAAVRFAAAVPGSCLVQLGLALGFLLAVRAVAHDRDRGALLLASVLALDLLVAGRPLVPTQALTPALNTDLASTVARICGARRLFDLATWQESGKPPGTSSVLYVPAGWGIATAFDIDVDLTRPRWSARATRLFFDAVRADPALMSPLLARRGVRLVLQQRETGGPRVAQIVSVAQPRPDIACADRLVRFSGDAGWLAAVRKLGAGARTAALVEAGDWPRAPEEPSPCTVVDATIRPGVISTTVTGAGPGYSVVLINQTWHPGWRLTVDGGRAALHRVDLDLGAAVVPPGRHRIEMTYRDRWLTGSLAVSCAALALCVALALPARRFTRAPGARDRAGR